MALFNRKKSVNEDINEYYASERRRRISMAWILGFATLVVTVLLALGLFYGGRWVYRTVVDDGESATDTEQVTDDPARAPAGESNNRDSTNNNGLLDGITLDESPEFNDPDNESDNNQSDSTDQQEGNPQGSTGTSRTPSVGPNQLPSTGPTTPEL